MKVVRVDSKKWFEAEGELSIGEFVKAGDVIAISAEVHQEEEEIVKYLSKGDVERIKAFLPDLGEPKFKTKFIILMDVEGKEPRNLPKIGDDVEIMDEREIAEVHFREGELSVPYLPYLMRKDRNLARIAVMKLMDLFPEYREIFDVILAEIEYSLLKEVDL